ncbi:MAG TPA: YncE family protein [Candidatus Angelobacter sp.]|nr:YncE family protein [Candidatus Angelobacter sp.]
MLTAFLLLAAISVAQTGKPDAVQQQAGTPDKSADNGAHRRIVQEGLAVDFAVDLAKPGSAQKPELRQGDAVTFRFQISDTASGRPITNAHPAAWVDTVAAGESRSSETCTNKLKTFLGGGFNSKPASDLNVFFVVAMNADATLSVIDPLLGYGDSKLLTLVSLPAPAHDWTLTGDQARIFVSMPQANKVAVVDTKSWTIAASTQILLHPSRVALQPDEHYLWVASGESAPDANDSGVSVLTANDLKLAARVVTGRGDHEIVFSADNRFAFVSNRAQNTVSVIDVRSLKKIADVNTGMAPSSLTYSSKAGLVYAANPGDGTITAIDAARHLVAATIKVAPGVTQVRFAPDGRYAFAINSDKNEGYIIDSASNELVQTFDTKTKPDRVSFSDTLAYIRHKGHDEVLMVSLDQIGKRGAPVGVADFPAGNNPPGLGADSPADGVVQAPGEEAVLVADPKDQSIYYYRAGMAAPSGTFSNYGREPKAVMVVDRSLREKSAPGLYESSGVLGRSGMYEVVFFLDSPKLVHCFPLRVDPNPALMAETPKVQFLAAPLTVRSGEKLRVRFRVFEEPSNHPEEGIKDVQATIYLAPGMWSSRQLAQPAGEPGVYAVEFTPPRPGVYYLHVASATLGLKETGQQYLILRAIPQDAPEVPAGKGSASR